MSGIVVIGAGQAGSALVAKLRSLGHDGPLTLIGAETDPPYQRPPLSKAYLLGEMPRERLWLRPPSFYAEQGIALRTGVAATAIDRAARRVSLSDGTALDYDRLALTTGARPRRLPAALGGDLGGVFTVRTLADVDAMAPAMRPGARLLVVGGGYIGLEAAAVARKLGLAVTLIELAPRILARVACAETAAWFRALHLSHGVDLREATGLDRLEGDGQVRAAVLSDGTRLPVDLVVVGIGAATATALAEAAGLAVADGIEVDEALRTSAPDVWAAGDVARVWSPALSARVRTEHAENALAMGRAAGQSMAGEVVRWDHLPSWSSSFFGHAYEAVGTVDARLETVAAWQRPLREGAVYYLERGRVKGVLLWGLTGRVEAARELIRRQRVVVTEELTRGVVG